MGLKLSTMWNLMFAKQEVRVTMIGLDAAGKTATLNRLAMGEAIATIPTIGFNVQTVEYKNLKMTMWDVGGQHRLRKLWRHYYEHTSVVIFVVDSADRARLVEAAEELHHALSDDHLRNATVLVYANKQDLPNALPVPEVQEALKLRELRGRKWYIQGCTATTGAGLFEGLDWASANLPKIQTK